MRMLEHRVMQDFVQEHREVEHDKALHDSQRYPQHRVIDTDQTPRRQTKQRELARGDQKVPPCRLVMQRAKLIARNRLTEFVAQLDGVMAVEVRLHKELR